MIDQIIHIFSPEYLFNKNLGPYQSNIGTLFAGFNVLIIVLAIILRRLAKEKDLFIKKAVQKYGSWAWTMGAIGIILYIFRQINVMYLSAPIIVLIWAIIAIIWLILVLKYRIITVPKRRKDLMIEKGKRDYLP
ncbi:MAG: hypothetical protein AUJ34_03435 [Parcubacteria group bacterium CG1_02_41_12]|nr:MAG: hypothetical protein AUJ34_03435 [Parcubacteria group bacterium CG1_02_41_12]PIP67008.1 MAG: hypothetical protein COW93_02545 [Parcubacteria group bacterium CG22_combo_CG10-13_8_21_14_all_41_9]PIQ80171.1 MAG: hypothetical protein COV79_01940 [Parcubacteria group bacterium CG11_big_fil_rev_8_21_14_0_20_41_14]PIR57149.1 MAG: hypothetical protein COU72_02515 [Parcubacteria group bacterium CG10_big_fil_rev_8_21_14_0_10_41_35]PIZ81759.1 MAG: hypothetical protein COY02_01030 [Parcubacteria gr